jgi:apolipoprotein N-acyltransferase
MLSLTPLRRVRLLLALASGLILAFGFAPHHAPLVAWLAMAMLVFAALDARLPIALACGLLHGTAFYGLTLAWVQGVMQLHGGLAAPAAACVHALMVLVLSLFTAAFCVAVAWISRRNIARACAAAPFLWVACEFGRHHMPSIGFPWNLLGYAVSDNLGLLQLATLTGIYGLSFLVAGYGAVTAWLLAERSKRAFGCWLALTAALLPVTLVGARFVPSEIPQPVARLVQTNLPQKGYGADWQEQFAPDLDELERLSIVGATTETAPAGVGEEDSASSTPAKLVALIVWPEVPAPFYLQDKRFAERAQRIAAQAQTHFLVGHIEWKPDAGGRLHPYNSAALLGPGGERLYAYDKMHLVAFGEYVPWRHLLRFAEKLVQEVGDFRAGTERSVGQLPGGSFATVICFEAVFPNEVRKFVAGGAELLVNISNDGWFGRSAAPDQHLAMARVRAVENRRWLLRATNNGYSVSVDPYGRIVSRMETDRRGALDVPFAFRSERTLYSRFGDWLAWLSLFASVIVVARTWRSKRSVEV